MENLKKIIRINYFKNNYMNKSKEFKNLVNIITELREKCPWDKKQTNDSLRTLTIEECYELSEAIIEKDDISLKKELGDLLTHIIFYSIIAEENKSFSLSDVISSQSSKLINRHPHIYGELNTLSESEVKKNWETIKLKEKGSKNSVLSGVPKSVPTMLKSWRIQEKVRGIGFEWNSKEGYVQKMEEELIELKRELSGSDKKKMEEELGDFLFSIISYSHFMQINPLDALERSNQKFIKRFSQMEQNIIKDKQKIQDLNIEDFEKYWNDIKLNEFKK